LELLLLVTMAKAGRYIALAEVALWFFDLTHLSGTSNHSSAKSIRFLPSHRLGRRGVPETDGVIAAAGSDTP
jgi:hypothetical protein